MSRPVELPTRSMTCAACGVRHENTALCDDCAQHCAIAIERHSEHDCGCRSCNVHRRAMLALLDTDLAVYRLREVQDARGLPSVAPVVTPAPVEAPTPAEAPAEKPAALVTPVVDDAADALPWERAYTPLATLLDAAHTLAWQTYGAPRVRLSTLDGARWQVVAIDEEGAVQTDAPTHVATSPDEAVAGWCDLVTSLSSPVLERGPAPMSLAAPEYDEDAPIPFVLSVDGTVTSLATGEVLGSVAPALRRAEVA